MNIDRIHRDIAVAQQQFAAVERHATTDGGIYILAALQTAQRVYTLSVSFPRAYPNEMPSVFVRKPTLSSTAPHRYTDGRLCFLHPSMWNPGRHDLSFVLARTAKWLHKYEVWQQRHRWPGKEVPH